MPTIETRRGKPALFRLTSSRGDEKPVNRRTREFATRVYNAFNPENATAVKVIVAYRETWATAEIVVRNRWGHKTRWFQQNHPVTVTGSYTSWRALPGHEDRDICAYCGADNTNARVGFDCYQCGGN